MACTVMIPSFHLVHVRAHKFMQSAGATSLPNRKRLSQHETRLTYQPCSELSTRGTCACVNHTGELTQ